MGQTLSFCDFCTKKVSLSWISPSLQPLAFVALSQFKLRQQRETNFGDAFTISKINKIYLDDFNFVINLIPVFMRYIRFYQGNKVGALETLSNRDMYKKIKEGTTVFSICQALQHTLNSSLNMQGVAEVLTTLKNNLIENATPLKRRQKLFRHLRIIEIFVEMLRCPFAPPAGRINFFPNLQNLIVIIMI